MSNKPAIQRGSSGCAALGHLAENGPTPEEGLVDVLAARSVSPTARTSSRQVVRRLEDLGLVTTKVWLTPDGLDAAKRLGELPYRAGVVLTAPSCGCTSPCGCPV